MRLDYHKQQENLVLSLHFACDSESKAIEVEQDLINKSQDSTRVEKHRTI